MMPTLRKPSLWIAAGVLLALPARAVPADEGRENVLMTDPMLLERPGSNCSGGSALAASEITGGGGGDSFCPNVPLTRGQMAVLLAKALGLHWGSF